VPSLDADIRQQHGSMLAARSWGRISMRMARHMGLPQNHTAEIEHLDHQMAAFMRPYQRSMWISPSLSEAYGS
jgi:hypothetical protein